MGAWTCLNGAESSSKLLYEDKLVLEKYVCTLNNFATHGERRVRSTSACSLIVL